jgi:hypothetical protein
MKGSPSRGSLYVKTGSSSADDRTPNHGSVECAAATVCKERDKIAEKAKASLPEPSPGCPPSRGGETSWRRRRVRKGKLPRVLRRLTVARGENPIARMVLGAQQRFAKETTLLPILPRESFRKTGVTVVSEELRLPRRRAPASSRLGEADR